MITDPPQISEALAAESLMVDRSIYRLLTKTRKTMDAKLAVTRPLPMSATKHTKLQDRIQSETSFLEGLDGLFSSCLVTRAASAVVIERTAHRLDPARMGSTARFAAEVLEEMAQKTTNPRDKKALFDVLDNVRMRKAPQLVSLSGIH